MIGFFEMGDLSTDFSLEEFVRTSSRALTDSEVSEIDRVWVDQILQPTRTAFDRALIVTSTVRHRDKGSAHAIGVGAVDVVMPGISTKRLADFIAAHFLAPNGPLVQVIDERNHVHLATVLVPGASPGYLHEPTEGKYAFRDVPPVARLGLMGILLGLGLLSLTKT